MAMGDIAARILADVSQAEINPTNHLLAGYLQQAPQVRDLFAHTPAEIPQLARQARAQGDRATLADALSTYQQHLGAHPAAVESARLLADPATPVITVGQQCCIFAGPLYTIYKAATAIALAHRLASELGRPVVPVFWAATDDDDRAEADHAALWDRQYVLHPLHYPAEAGEPGQLIGELPVAGYGEALLAQAQPLLEGLPYAEETLALLHETLAASADLGEWFCRLLSRLFSRHGLVLCDPRLPAMRRLGAEVMRREISQPLRTTELVNRQARVIQQRGMHPALIKPEETSNFFLFDGRRRRVSYRHGRYFAGDNAYTPPELLALLEQEPERVLPNAVLRPVVQEYLFGSTAFVAGPNELGYWAELQLVFAALDVEMPVVAPRAGATLAPPAVARRLQEWDVAPFDLLQRYDQVRFALLARQQPEAVGQSFAQSRETLQQVVSQIRAAVAQVDSTLAQSAMATEQRMLNELERLEHKTLKAVERQAAQHTDQLAQARDILFPGHGLQERTLNICSLLARCGADFVADLPMLFDRQEGRHIVVEL